jgi:pimeloyl-ACP methyl ester carboxylesterase
MTVRVVFGVTTRRVVAPAWRRRVAAHLSPCARRPLPSGVMHSDDWQPGPVVTGAGGVPIATWDLGGDGPPLLLVHATGFHARMWLPIAPALRSTHRLWAIDLRGHGDSGHHPDGDYRDWSLFVDDLLAVVDTLDLGDATTGLVGAGHSLGGAVLLLSEQRRPGLLGAVYCYEPIVPTPETRTAMVGEEMSLAVLSAKRRAGFASRQAARDNYASKPPFARFAPEALDAYVDHAFRDAADGTVELKCSPAEESTVYRGAPLHAAWEHLGATTPPITVAGSAANIEPARTLPSLAARLPHARLERYEELSHFGPMEDPLRVGAAIVAAVGPSPPDTDQTTPRP